MHGVKRGESFGEIVELISTLYHAALYTYSYCSEFWYVLRIIANPFIPYCLIEIVKS